MDTQKNIKVGINGFGRIGRTIFRQIQEIKGYEVVQINDLNPDIHNICYLLNYDSMHGMLARKAEVKTDHLVIEGFEIKVSHKEMITDAKWEDRSVDILIE